MKGVGRLIENELIKLSRRISWRVITIILLVISILGPIVTHLAMNVLNGVSVGGMISFFEYEDMPEIEREYFNAVDDTDRFFAEQGINTQHWKYGTYYYDYYDSALSVKALELIKDGEDPVDVYMMFDSYYIDYEYSSDGDISQILYYADGDFSKEGVPFTKELAEELYPEEKAAFDSLEKEIKETTVSDIAEMYIPIIEGEVASAESKFISAEKKYEITESAMDEYLKAKYELEAAKAILSVYKSMKDTKPEDETWLMNTADVLTQIGSSIVEFAAVDEDSFIKDAELTEEYITYDYYKDRMTDGYETCHAALETLKYSAEQKIPVPEVLTMSTKSFVEDSVVSSFSTVMLFCMILAATILSSEYSSGSVRLLLIRPRARWKILLSKMMGVAVYGIAVFFAMSILSAVTHFIIGGVGDFFTPYLEYANGSVRESIPVLHMLGRAVITALPDIMFVALAFMLSVVLKKAVFSISIPIFIYIVGSIITTVTYNFIPKYGILKYTILPYLNIEELMQSDVYNALYSYSMFGFSGAVRVGLTVGVAAIMLILHIAVITAVSFLVFRRQQIKN